jgi:hypothetical protein
MMLSLRLHSPLFLLFLLATFTSSSPPPPSSPPSCSSWNYSQGWDYGPTCPSTLQLTDDILSLPNSSFSSALEQAWQLVEATLNLRAPGVSSFFLSFPSFFLPSLPLFPSLIHLTIFLRHQWGFSVGIVYNQTTFYQGFGRVNISTTSPPNQDTVYPIGSMTKVTSSSSSTSLFYFLSFTTCTYFLILLTL